VLRALKLNSPPYRYGGHGCSDWVGANGGVAICYQRGQAEERLEATVPALQRVFAIHTILREDVAATISSVAKELADDPVARHKEDVVVIGVVVRVVLIEAIVVLDAE